MKPHEQRVIDEKTELDGRIQKLVDFFQTDLFAGLGSYDQALMQMQANAMLTYAGILTLRISQFMEPTA